MVKHECLVVAQIADGVVTVVRILKGAYPQVRQAIQIQHLFEVSNSVLYRQVKNETAKRYKCTEIF